ncbi:hypothetical protein C0J52_01990 [Blattella germanica]|nr:hypothetical protein C0J52_01990 [Blattella germanica]
MLVVVRKGTEKMQTNCTELDGTRSDLQTWSSLNTVSKFDAGSTVLVKMTDNGVALRDANKLSPTSLLVESLVEELCKLLSRNSQQQKKLYDLICGKLYQMKLIDNYKLEAPDFVPSSRYKSEFEELEYIAKGGFGRVYKSRNKLDGMNYAIKKICLQYHNVPAFLRNLHEVKMLARLNHPNIVTYKAAWLEPLIPAPRTSTNVPTKSSDEESNSIVFESSRHEEEVYKSETTSHEEISYQSVNVTHEEETVYESASTSSPDSPEETSSSLLGARALSPFSPDNSNSIYTIDESGSSQDFKLCTYQGASKSVSNMQNFAFPSNIFINADITQVQVGDFGLACYLQHSSDDVTLLTDYAKHGEIGTKLYAAPEQLRGRCDPKSDVYSLGVVLFELLQPFSTDMERCKLIAQAQLISRLVKQSPALRPTACGLQEIIVPLIKETLNGSESVDSMKQTIQQLLAVISEKDKAIEEKDKEIEGLQQRLRNLEMPSVET